MLVAVAATSLAACGSTGDSSASVKRFCDVVDRTQGEVDAMPDTSNMTFSELGSSVKELQNVLKEREDAAPPSQKRDYADDRKALSLSADESHRPSAEAAAAARMKRENTYILKKCHIDLNQ